MKISDSLRSYVSIYKNFIPEDLRKDTLDNLKNAEWDIHAFYNPKTEQTASNYYDLSVSRSNIYGKKEIQDSLWHAIHRYMFEDHKEINGWWSAWNGYTELRFNKYDIGTSMDLHCDHIHSMFDGERKGVPILTVLGALNDDYEGGDFVMWGDEVIDFPAGSVMIFPSNFLYPHQVKAITSGVRYSCVSWVW